MAIPFKLHDQRTFRTTPDVHFADIGVPGSNGLDLVRHSGPAISPPDKDGIKQFYTHVHQIDNNRVLAGSRLFELVCFEWEVPHWYVYLTPYTGALEIPLGCLHRSYSCKEGSILINQATRGPLYTEANEFIPVSFTPKVVVAAGPAIGLYNITDKEVAHFIEHGTLA